jgi:hypothetical protein
MLTINLGENVDEEQDDEEKIHHDHSNLKYFLIMFLFVKLSYFAIFYIIDSNMKITTVKYEKYNHPIGESISNLIFIEILILFIVAPLLLYTLQLIRSATFHYLSRIGFTFVAFIELINYMYALIFYVTISAGEYNNIIPYKFFTILDLIFQIPIFLYSMGKILKFDKKDSLFLSHICFIISIILASIGIYIYTINLMENIILENVTKTVNFFG